VKLLRTIQLDASDSFVFDRAAAPGEWAVSGAFAFLNRDIPALTGKNRTAFRAGFLGIGSLGRSTLVQIVNATEQEREDVVGLLAAQLVGEFGAPDLASATGAAMEEVAFAASLCDHPAGVIVAVTRSLEGGRSAKRSARCAPLPNFHPGPSILWRSLVENKIPTNISTLQRSGRNASLSDKQDFWFACGHHVLDRHSAGRLMVTDEFLKAYLARGELCSPCGACPAERRLHDVLRSNLRQVVYVVAR
jgi:hypothetical protein